MKTVIMAAAIAALSATVAAADPLSFIGNSEYAFEAEVFELNAGVQYDVNQWELSAVANSEYASGEDFDFTGVELKAAFQATESVNIYAIIETDADLDYQEATIGTAFKF